jgi:TolB-like protein
MKSYSAQFCKLIPAAIMLGVTLLFCGCIPGRTVTSTVELHSRLPKIAFAYTPTMLILPFENIEQSPALGLTVARIFLEQVVRRHSSIRVIIPDNAALHRELLYRDTRAPADVLNRARSFGADLVLAGSVPVYHPGSTGNTQVTIQSRLIEVASGAILWAGSGTAAGRSGHTVLLWNMLLSPDPPDADLLVQAAVTAIVDDMLPDGARITVPGPAYTDRQGTPATIQAGAVFTADNATVLAAPHDAPEPLHALPDSYPVPLPQADALDRAYDELLSLPGLPGDDAPPRH